MNHRKFSALAALAGARDSKATAAARLVLVEGISKAKAARELGINPAVVRRAVLRIEGAEAKAAELLAAAQKED